MKRNEGFTLIELLVTVSAGTLVTFAAVSLLLLGARVQYRTTQEAQEQQRQEENQQNNNTNTSNKPGNNNGNNKNKIKSKR